MHSTENSNKNSGSIVSNQSQQTNLNRECAGCGKPIAERFLLKALDLFWHEDCLKCGCCDCRLGEVGSTLFTKANLILCRRDYLRLFGTTGYCAACNKVIPAFEMVMRAKNNVYHLECFACQQCNHRFCVGDRFYLCENKILCEYDYEERLVFANMTYNPSSLAHIRRQVSNLQPPRDNLIGTNNKQAIHSLPNKKNPKDDKRLAHSSSFPGSSSSGNGNNSNDNGNNNPTQHQHQLQPQQPLQVNQHHHGAIGTTDDAASSGYGSPDSEIFEQ